MVNAPNIASYRFALTLQNILLINDFQISSESRQENKSSIKLRCRAFPNHTVLRQSIFQNILSTEPRLIADLPDEFRTRLPLLNNPTIPEKPNNFSSAKTANILLNLKAHDRVWFIDDAGSILGFLQYDQPGATGHHYSAMFLSSVRFFIGKPIRPSKKHDKEQQAEEKTPATAEQTSPH